MNWLDWVVLIYAGLGAINGWRHGLSAILLGFVGFLLGWWAAVNYANSLTAFMNRNFHVGASIGAAFPKGSGFFAPYVEYSVALIIIFKTVEVLVGVIGGAAMAPLVKLGPGMNQAAGGLLGGLRSLLVAVVILYFLTRFANVFPVFQGISSALQGSKIASPMTSAVVAMVPREFSSLASFPLHP